MNKMQRELEDAGFATANIDYPSREHTVEELADIAVNEGLEAKPLPMITPQPPRAVEQVRPLIAEVARQLVDVLDAHDLPEFDVIEALAAPLQRGGIAPAP